MSTELVAATVVLSWLLASVVLSLVVGRAMRHAERSEAPRSSHPNRTPTAIRTRIGAPARI